jgi:hypothetical protein
VTRHVALTGDFQYAYDVLHEESFVQKDHSFSGNAGFGVRLGDCQFDASYSFSAHDVDGTFAKPRWGSVRLSAYFLFSESFSVTVSGHGAEDGGGAGIDLAFFTAKDLAFFAGLAGQTFVYVIDGRRASAYDGSLGLSYWVTPTLRFSWGYALGLDNTPSQPLQPFETQDIEHSLSVGVVARLP